MEPLVVDEGATAKFRVEFEANPRPVVKWLRYTFQLKSSDFIHFEHDDNSASLIIDKVCLDDSGIFTCLLENPAGSTKSSTNLTVVEKENLEAHEESTMTTYSSQIHHESKSSQMSTSSVKTMHVKTSDRIRIDIQFKDGSKSDLTFTHDDKPLTESNEEGIQITFSNDIATLTIDNANTHHSGMYQCIMKTEGGEARCHVKVLVE